MQFVLERLALVQANKLQHVAAHCRRLADGICACRVWLHRVPIVMTAGESAQWNSTERWIRENMFELVLHGPFYQGSSHAHVQHVSSNRYTVLAEKQHKCCIIPIAIVCR